jgi:ADP-ribose pyrophosphatase
MKERTINSRRKFTGRLIKVDLLNVRLDNGRDARREIVRHPGAVAVLCRRPDGRFVFVRQFRKPVESELLEIVAGTREPDEAPAVCARREVHEETGYKVVALKRLGGIYTAPGFCDERVEIFFAEIKLSGIQGCPDHDEQIELVCLDKKQIEAMLASGMIKDAKTLSAWTMYNLSRRRPAVRK